MAKSKNEAKDLPAAGTPDHKLPLTSPDLAAERLAALRDLMPEVFAGERVDWNKLKLMLGEAVDEGRERFGLTWPGKAEAMRAVLAPSTGTLVPDREQSVDFDTSENVFIEGDNLEVLKLLQRGYHGAVRLIYIDPPYNTGNEFIYPDNYREGLQEYLRFSRQVDSEGVKTTTNTEASGRFHSKWLSMMWPRLFLARNLLSEDGIIVASIDDHEQPHLRLIMDEIFGSENFIANIVWQKAYVANMTAKHLSTTHDYLVAYARSAEFASVGRLPRSQDQIDSFTNPDDDPRGPWKAENLSAGKYYSAGQFVINSPSGAQFSPPPGRYWRCNEAVYKSWLADGRITFGRDGNGRPMLKKFLAEVRDGLTPDSWWKHEDCGTNKEATIALKEMFQGAQVFDTPKPVRLLQRLMALFATRDSIVMDFFAGSGSFAHATLTQNDVDGGCRRYVAIQLPEPVESPQTGTIADIARQRLRLAGQMPGQSNMLYDTGTRDTGFRAFRLSHSNFKEWQVTRQDLKGASEQLPLLAANVDDRTVDESILFELLLKAGLPLTSKIDTTTVTGVEVHLLEGGKLVVCLAKRMTQALVDGLLGLAPPAQRIFCLDAAFEGNDQLLTNTVLQMKAANLVFKTV